MLQSFEECGSVSTPKPEPFLAALTVRSRILKLRPFRLHPLLDDRKQVWPVRRHRMRVIRRDDSLSQLRSLSLLRQSEPTVPRLLAPQRKVLEVNHVAVVRVRGGVVHLFAADVG